MVDIPKEDLVRKLISFSPFHISDVVDKLIPSKTPKEKERLFKRIYNLLKYYHADNWVSSKVKDGSGGRPKSVWSYVGDYK